MTERSKVWMPDTFFRSELNNHQKVAQCTKKLHKVPKSSIKYQKIEESTKMYYRVPTSNLWMFIQYLLHTKIFVFRAGI